MSKRVGKLVIIEPEAPRTCELCGTVAETRPYGPKGEQICFACGEKNPEATQRRMGIVLFGAKPN